jgi:hypothetical protein
MLFFDLYSYAISDGIRIIIAIANEHVSRPVTAFLSTLSAI